jgi:hypothetical protein
MLAWLAWLCAISARPERTAEPWRFMSSDEGGVGTTSSSVRRSRASRAGVVRTAAGVAFRAFGFRVFGFGDWRFRARVDAAAFFDLALAFGFAARRRWLGRLAERAER